MNRNFFKNALIICISIIAMFACNCTAFAATGRQTIYLHYFTKGAKEVIYNGYSNENYNDIKCKLKSNSNPSAVGAKVVKTSSHNQELKLVGKKIGTSTVKCTFTLDGEKNNWIIKVKVKKYDCPLKKITIGKTDLTKLFRYNSYNTLNKKSISGKINVSLKPGWYISYMNYYKDADSSFKKLDLKKKVTIKRGGNLTIGLKYKHTEEFVAIQLNLV